VRIQSDKEECLANHGRSGNGCLGRVLVRCLGQLFRIIFGCSLLLKGSTLNLVFHVAGDCHMSFVFRRVSSSSLLLCFHTLTFESTEIQQLTLASFRSNNCVIARPRMGRKCRTLTLVAPILQYRGATILTAKVWMSSQVIVVIVI
jgi:hypothetical protein